MAGMHFRTIWQEIVAAFEKQQQLRANRVENKNPLFLVVIVNIDQNWKRKKHENSSCVNNLGGRRL